MSEKRVHFELRLPRHIQTALKLEAEREHRSLNEQIVIILEGHVLKDPVVFDRLAFPGSYRCRCDACIVERRGAKTLGVDPDTAHDTDNYMKMVEAQTQ